MELLGIFLAGLCNLLLAGCLPDSGSGRLTVSDGTARLPLEERGALVVARMDIGEARGLPVLVDTGTAGGLVISPEVMARVDPTGEGAPGTIRRDLVWRGDIDGAEKRCDLLARGVDCLSQW